MTIRQLFFSAIGTDWQLQTTDAVTDEVWDALVLAVCQRIDKFDIAYSRFRADSLVTHISQQAGTYELPADGYELLQAYEKLYRVTDGTVTPLIGQALADAGYDADYSLQSKPLSAVPSWEDVLEYTQTSLTTKQPVLLDFGAAGKGYLVDIVAGLLHAAGLRNYLINASGDLLQRSRPDTALQVGLENPADTSEAIGIVELHNQSLCASASNKRCWGEYHHVLDPRSLRSTADVVATWVVAADTMTADGLATALFFTPASELAQAYNFSYALIDAAGGLQYSRNFPLTVFEAA